MYLFIFYRLVEKFTSVRLEGWIGFVLFFMSFGSTLRKRSCKKTILDKRSWWEKLRLNDCDEPFEQHIQNLFCFPKVSFENSMETSIRGIHCILSIRQKTRSGVIEDTLNRYINAAYWHSIICPDLYVKRSRLLFKDESNNHRFYNLLFHQFYNLHFKKEASFDAIETFVKQRLVQDHFYDEGSSFYHFGVIDALLKLRAYAKAKNSKINFSYSFNHFLDTVTNSANIMQCLNFGDRDGTTIAPWVTPDSPIRFAEDKIHTQKFFLQIYRSNILMLRKENWCEIGTQGHVHDDYGHLIYRSSDAAILDPGIFKYSEEPFFAKKKFHNFPYDRKLPQISYVRKFERKVPRNKHLDVNGTGIILSEFGKDYRLIRDLNIQDWHLHDYADCGANQDILISWRFFLNGAINVSASRSQLGLTVKVGSAVQFNLHPNAIFRVCESQYFPEYGQPKGCNVLLIRLKIKTAIAKKVKLLSIDFTCDAEER